MKARPDDVVRQVTSELSEEKLWDLSLSAPDVAYHPVPLIQGVGNAPVWRVRFYLTYDPKRRFGLDINGEVILGRGENGPGFVSLDALDAEELGVSRRHVMLRPTDTKLYVIDLDSTNGTYRNGRSIGVNTPYSLSNGDLLTLGSLELAVRIIQQPVNNTSMLSSETELADVLVPVARAITSQLTVDEVLRQALDLTVSLGTVDEAAIWLVDEQTGELFIEAAHGVEDEYVQNLRLSVNETLAGKVIATGQPVRANRQAGGEQIKVKTGYLVEAVIYVPLTLGGVTFGVLSAAHHVAGNRFSARDEKLMAAIADFTAVAVQNARLYEATDTALTRRVKIMTAINYALAHNLKDQVNSVIGYAGLLGIYNTFDEESSDIVMRISESGNSMAHLIDQLQEIVSLNDVPIFQHAPCDLVEETTRAMDELYQAAETKGIEMSFQLVGEPILIYGDAAHLHRSVWNLIDNAIRYSPNGAAVWVTLAFTPNEIMIRVRDTGYGIPEEDLPHIFERFYRGPQSLSGEAGIGLGLEFVRATAKAHRGIVTVRNADDQGAEFMITLPTTLRVR